MNVLVTNDDGIDAPGFIELARRLEIWASQGDRRVIIAAPSKNMSGMSSAVGDIHDHPRVQYEPIQIPDAPHITAFRVEAPPALCVILGVLGAFGSQPDFILSGINAGANVGTSILHSGTVGAVLTGAQHGVSGMAVSVQWGPSVHFAAAAEIAVDVLTSLPRLAPGTVLNLNVPNLPIGEIKGVKRARISGAALVSSVRNVISSANSDIGHSYIEMTFGAASPELGDVSDEDADDDGALIANGFATLTPIRGPQEDSNPAFDASVRHALEIIDKLLRNTTHP